MAETAYVISEKTMRIKTESRSSRIGTVRREDAVENPVPMQKDHIKFGYPATSLADARSRRDEAKRLLWCAPTVDERDIWQCSMRHIAHEGRCFVVSACQIQPSPAELGIDVPGWDGDRPLINGGSVIVGPLGDVLAGPLRGQAGLVVAEIDTDDLVRARYDFDVVGHYARPDVFSLSVDERAKRSVEFKD
ncbi:nitrilase [Burkholderia humptydooensis]|uniref:Nitrilase n=2 Tax=Burkholderia humptydooensis TaxID=430531 RepID=A0A7U4SR83_9BURK|nr:nitrilase [Burkholderia humptydooensis]EIP84896.1 Nitrilase/cyanide hydratase and apolipoprotein N-acyltransferase [Burkholderia humptydooensis MSMB43]QPS43511.1 nitrilase [Burkholderia humptydooensis]